MKIADSCIIQEKSKIKAGSGLASGRYKFFTSSNIQTKWLNDFQYCGPALIFGTGGKPSVHFCDTPFSTSTDCVVLNGTSAVELAMIFHYLSDNMHILQKGFHGIGLQHISPKFILDIELPDINLDQQKKIVRISDKLDKLISLRTEQLLSMDELVKSRFVEMFGDMMSNPMNWSEKPLGTVADIVSGITKGRKARGQRLYEVPYMAVSNVKDGYIDWTTVKKIMATEAEIKKYRLHPLDVLMTEGGDPDKLGRGAILHSPIENCIHQNHIFRVRLNNKFIVPTFFAQYLQLQRAKQYFLRCAKQTTGIASINMKQLHELPVLLPSVELQNQFAAFVEQIEKSNLAIQDSLNKLEMLKKALMQECFG